METIDYIEPKGCTQADALIYLQDLPQGITFIHGKAGCGKTYLIKKVESSIGGCQVLAPTNLAASLYKNGRTLHSFFYGGFDDLDEGFQDPNNLTSERCAVLAPRISQVRMLVIDEISMVRADTFEMMNQICQRCKRSELPFGYSGIAMKIVVIGGLVLIILFTLSYFFHIGIINYFLKLTTGTSLLFFAYIAACILLLDIRVECTTFLVDHKAHVYHLEWNDDCEDAANAEELEEMYGYEIDASYSFCEGCKECEEDVESEAAIAHVRR